MEGYFIDFVVSLFFLTALIFTAKSRIHISEENIETYRYISSGLVTLTLAAVSRLAFYQGLFSTIPFLSEELFYSLTYWIMSITGIVLLANGVTNWLPLNQTLRKYNKTHFHHISLLKDLEQLVAVEKRPDYIIQKSLDHMVEHFDAIRGVVFTCSSQENQSIFISGDDSESDKLKEIRLKSKIISSNKQKSNLTIDEIISELPENITDPEVLLPVWVDGKLTAVFLLWIEDSFAYEDDQIVLKIAADIVGRAIKARKDNLALEYFKTQDQQINHIRNLFNYNKGIRDNLTRVVQYLKEIMNIDYVSLIILYSTKDIHRYTIGYNGTILCEKGLDQDVINIINNIKETDGSIKIITKNDLTDNSGIKPFLNEKKVETLISCSLENRVGLLNVGVESDRKITLREKHLLLRIRQVFSQYVASEINKFNEDKLIRRFDIINKFREDITAKGSVQQVFEKAVRVVMKELKTSLVRIASFEDEGEFLKSKAMSVIHQGDDLVPEDGYMILSLMPTVQGIKETGDSRLINQEDDDKRITLAEAGQIYSTDLRMALLVPIKMGSEVKAIIMLADRRKGSRFHYTEDDIMFVNSIANLLSISLNLNKIDYKTIEVKEVIRRIPNLDNSVEIKGSIRSYLSGINGSVEMIKSHHPQNDEYLNRYLSIIDRSVKSINDCLSGQKSSMNEKVTT